MDENDDMLSDGQVIFMFVITFLVIFMLAISGCSRGSQGDPGTPGIDISPITVVQLCTGVTPTYPNVFPEIGLCIAGNLYAVYSANGGFLVYTPPGAYYSNGINASCTFTVGPNCEIN